MATRRVTPADPETVDTPTRDAAGNWQIPVDARAALAELGAEEQADLEELAIGERVRLLLAQTGGERVTLKLYRIDPKSRSMPWCCDYTPEEFANGDLEMIRQQWGPGEYEMRVIGSRGIIAKPRFTIASPYAMVQHNPAHAPQTAAPAAQSELAAVLTTLAQSQAAIMQALQGLQQAQQGPQNGMLGALDMLRAARDILGPQTAPAPAADPMATFTQIAGAMRAMRELSQEINPPTAADPDNPLSLAGPIIDMIKTAMQARNGGAAPFPMIEAPQMLNENPAQAYPQNAPADPAPNESEPMMLVLKGAVQQLTTLAAANADPAQGGEFIYRGLPPDLIPYLAYPNWFDILASVAPELKPHREWIEKAKVHADALFAADDAAG